MPEKDRNKELKTREYQMLIDMLSTRDLNNQTYYFQIKGGKYFEPFDETVVCSHIANKNATGVQEFIRLVEKASEYDFDFIKVELFSKNRRHEVDAQKPFDTKVIVINDPPQDIVLSKQNNNLGALEQKMDFQQQILGFKQELMKKEFEIAQIKIENERLKDVLKKAVIKVDEYKDILKNFKTKYIKLNKTYKKAKDKTEKEINDLKDDVRIKKLVSTGLGSLAANLKIKGQDLGSLLGGFIDDTAGDNTTEENEQSYSSPSSQDFNIRKESELTELDQLKNAMIEQVAIYLKDKDENVCRDFYSILEFITKENNMTTILDLIK